MNALKFIFIFFLFLCCITSVEAKNTILSTNYQDYPFSLQCSDIGNFYNWLSPSSNDYIDTLTVRGWWYWDDLEVLCYYPYNTQYLDFLSNNNFITVAFDDGGYSNSFWSNYPYGSNPSYTEADLIFLLNQTFDISNSNDKIGFNFTQPYTAIEYANHLRFTIRLLDENLDFFKRAEIDISYYDLYSASYLESAFLSPSFYYPYKWHTVSLDKTDFNVYGNFNWHTIKQIEIIPNNDYAYYQWDELWVFIDDLFIYEYEEPLHNISIYPYYINNTLFQPYGSVNINASFYDSGGDFLTKSIWYSATGQNYTWEVLATSYNSSNEILGFIIPANYLPDNFSVKYCAYHYQEPTFYCLTRTFRVNYSVIYDSLHLWYDFEDGIITTINDFSNYNNDGIGTNLNLISNVSACKKGICINFNGSAYINTNLVSSLNMSQNFTYLGWIKLFNTTIKSNISSYQENAQVITCEPGATWIEAQGCSNLYDNNWESWGSAETEYTAYVKLNYTKYLNSSAIWVVRDAGSGYHNISIPSSCFNYYSKYLLLEIISDRVAPYSIRYNCYNGSYSEINITGIGADSGIYEESIFWIKEAYQNLDGNASIISNKNNSITDFNIFVNNTNGIFDLGFQNYIYDTNLSSNSWHHIAYTYNATNLCLYVNGLNFICQKYTNNLSFWQNSLYFGTDKNLISFLNFSLDDFRIYDYAVSSDFIQELANYTTNINLYIVSKVFDSSSYTWRYTLNWSDFPSTQLYRSYFKESGAPKWEYNAEHSSYRKSSIFTNLSCNTLYYFNISIVNNLNQELYSFIISDTTLSCIEGPPITTSPPEFNLTEEIYKEAKTKEEVLEWISTIIYSLFSLSCLVLIIVMIKRATSTEED